jgi:hypothetical protein
MRQEPPNDCVGCHMPRKPTAGIPHSNDTNHRIVRRAGEPYPDYAFDEPRPDNAKVVDYLTRALQKGGDYASTYVDLGEALARMGRVEESTQILEKGLPPGLFRGTFRNRSCSAI